MPTVVGEHDCLTGELGTPYANPAGMRLVRRRDRMATHSSSGGADGPPGGLGAGEQHRVRQHQGAADHQHVGRAPLRDVLAEQPVPQVVEGEAEQREQRDAGADRRADRDPPARGEGEGTPGEPFPGEREGERAPGEDRTSPRKIR
jgi:hypothetical protein